MAAADASPSIDRLAELQALIVQLAGVERIYNLPGLERRENDADHSYGLALTCWFLQPKIAPELDLLEIFKYALAHDLVEVHAGDTYVFDTDALAGKEGSERAAIEQLRRDWPDFESMAGYAEKYMDKASEEAKFVKAVDKMLPVLLIELDGADAWKKHQVTLEMLRQNKVTMHVSEYISPYYQRMIDWLDKRGNVPKGETAG